MKIKTFVSVLLAALISIVSSASFAAASSADLLNYFRVGAAQPGVTITHGWIDNKAVSVDPTYTPVPEFRESSVLKLDVQDAMMTSPIGSYIVPSQYHRFTIAVFKDAKLCDSVFPMPLVTACESMGSGSNKMYYIVFGAN